MAVELKTTQGSSAGNAQADERLDDLAQIVKAYNRVTENLQRSHESLQREVSRLQRELAGTNAQLQRSRRLAALGEMAAGIAHEIRNPLAAIQLYAGMLVQDLGPQTASHEHAGKIAGAVRGLDAVVSDVLTFSREISPRRQPLSIAELFERVIASHRPAIDAANVTVELAIPPDDLTVHADSDLLHQAMLNVVRNAIDAMAHSDTRVLSLAADVDDGQIVLTARDTGAGISDDDIDRIFNPFFTTRNTGTGLGLAIVHRIMDAHGGAITVRNEGGAIFELRLPADSTSKLATSPAATSLSGATA